MYFIQVGVNTRSTHSRGPFTGLAIIRRMRAIAGVGGANSDFFMVPGYNPTPVEESLVPVTNPYIQTLAFERLPIIGADYAGPTLGITNAPGLTQKIEWDLEVSYVVPISQWYLTITIGQVGGAGNLEWQGYVQVIDGLTADQLGQFLG